MMTKLDSSRNAKVRLYELNKYQKNKYSRHISFKVDVKDSFNLNVVYFFEGISPILDFQKYNGVISEKLLGKSVDYVITHLTVMEILLGELEGKDVGVCLDEEIENLLMKQLGKVV